MWTMMLFELGYNIMGDRFCQSSIYGIEGVLVVILYIDHLKRELIKIIPQL